MNHLTWKAQALCLRLLVLLFLQGVKYGRDSLSCSYYNHIFLFYSLFYICNTEMILYLMFILLFRVITGIIRLDLPENVFINFSNLAIL